MRGLEVALLAGAGLMLAACAGPVVLGINLGTASTVGSLAATAATGRGLGEHAVSALAEKDCRLIEPVFREDRKFCEEYDSPARKEDFKGLADLFDKPEDQRATMMAQVSPQAGGDIVVDKPETETTAARAVEAVEVAPVTGVTEAPPTAPAIPASHAAMPSRTKLPAAPPAPKAKPAAERAIAAAGTATAAAAAGPFSVRVGTYANAANAEAFARRLRADGYQAQVSRLRGDAKKFMSVVHITGFRDAAAAERAAAAVAREHDTQPKVVLTRA